MFTHFYHQLIRKYVVVFGNLFNNIWLYRYDKNRIETERMRVPLAYGPKEKFFYRLNQDPSLNKTVMMTLPRMSFEMLDFTYDESRKQITTISNKSNSGDPLVRNIQYMGVPYNFNFALSVYVRNIEDGTQIVEQILPYFTPDYTVTANLIPEMNISKDIPIILESVGSNIDYEGNFDIPRIVTWDFSFTMKGYFYGPILKQKIIGYKETITDPISGANTFVGGPITTIYLDDRPRLDQETITIECKVAANTGNGNFILNETIKSNTGGIGFISDWSPDFNKLTITRTSGNFDVGDRITGYDSNTQYVIDSLIKGPTKAVSVQVLQDPLTASVEDDFGFTVIRKDYLDLYNE